MKVIGIIAEYNPFHLGHLYQLKKVKEKFPDSCIVVLVSSTFTQRGEVSVMNGWEKTKLLLDNMVDLVIEFPFVYASQSADLFAKGAIEILAALQIDTLVFGGESDDVSHFMEVAKLQLYNVDYWKVVGKYLDKGLNYPTSLSKAIGEFGYEVIDTPNDLLGLAYVKEIVRRNLDICPWIIKRTNDYHSLDSKEGVLSGQAIRKKLLIGDDVSDYVVSDKAFYRSFSIENYFDLLRYQILTHVDSLEEFQTVDEGIENKIVKVIYEVDSFEELVMKLKSKRYTYNKIRRMLVHILTNFTKLENSEVRIDYIRVLGFSMVGRNYLNKIKKSVELPIITGYLPKISKLLDIEFRVHSIFYSQLPNGNDLMKREFNKKPIIQ